MGAVTKSHGKTRGARTDFGTKSARAALSRRHLTEGPRQKTTKGFTPLALLKGQ